MADGKRECPYCGKKYKGFKRHIKKQHPLERWPPITYGNKQPCKECGETPTRLVYGEGQKSDKYLCETHT